MYLVYCKNCKNVISLNAAKKVCPCGISGGHYVDGLHAVFFGEAIPLEFDNVSFVGAMADQMTYESKPFNAFVMKQDCPTMRSIGRPDDQ